MPIVDDPDGELGKRYLKQYKLEADDLWRGVVALAEKMYELLGNFPEEEKYGIAGKLRSSAFNSTSDIAEAIGCIEPNTRCYYLGMLRKDLLALKNAYRFAARQSVFKMDPEVMLTVDNFLDEVNKRLHQVQKDVNSDSKSVAS